MTALFPYVVSFITPFYLRESYKMCISTVSETTFTNKHYHIKSLLVLCSSRTIVNSAKKFVLTVAVLISIKNTGYHASRAIERVDTDGNGKGICRKRSERRRCKNEISIRNLDLPRILKIKK